MRLARSILVLDWVRLPPRRRGSLDGCGHAVKLHMEMWSGGFGHAHPLTASCMPCGMGLGLGVSQQLTVGEGGLRMEAPGVNSGEWWLGWLAIV